jgi:hypothetical protein
LKAPLGSEALYHLQALKNIVFENKKIVRIFVGVFAKG